MGPWYVTRERVKAATDMKETARNNGKVDAACQAATDYIERLTHRSFYPTIESRYFDWPTPDSRRTYRLYLNADLLAVTALSSGGTAIAAADYFLYPSYGPPYRAIEIDRASTASFISGDTEQRNIAITGTWGYSDDTEAATVLTEALDASEVGVDVADSSRVGVGDALLVGTEYMLVTARSSSTTGTTLNGNLTASASGTAVTVADGTKVHAEEIITIESERMLVEDVAGNVLTVRRAHDGSALAAHTGALTIYAPRTLTVTRGALGSAAAAHNDASAVLRHVPPALVSSLALAHALNTVISDSSGWARVAGEGVSARPASGVGLRDLIEQVEESYGIRSRIGAV